MSDYDCDCERECEHYEPSQDCACFPGSKRSDNDYEEDYDDSGEDDYYDGGNYYDGNYDYGEDDD
jgi:hypothetical protein